MDSEEVKVKAGSEMKCKNCGGKLLFDPTLGKLKCSSCESIFTTEEMEQSHVCAVKLSHKKTEYDEEERKVMQAYDCRSCGARLLMNNVSGTAKCPYCGSVVIAAEKFTGDIRPDHIIGFSYTKNQVIEKYKQYYEKRFLLPRSFKTDSHLEDIQGVYVPYWLFSGRACVDAEYDAYTQEPCDDETDMVIRSYYDVKRQGYIDYKHVPTDASKRMPDDLLDSIEPFDLDKLQPFSVSYFPGFMAERFDVNEKDNEKKARDRVKNTLMQKLHSTMDDYDDYATKKEKVSFEDAYTEYAMLPVWLLFTRYKGEEYKFAMNGQTGEMTGDLPISKLKVFLLCIPSILLTCLFTYKYFQDETGAFYFFIALIWLLVVFLMCISMKPVVAAGDAEKYSSEKMEMTCSDDKFREKLKIKDK